MSENETPKPPKTFDDVTLTHAFQVYFNPSVGSFICGIRCLKPYVENKVLLNHLSALMQACLVELSKKTDEKGFILGQEEWEEHHKRAAEIEERRKMIKILDGGIKNDPKVITGSNDKENDAKKNLKLHNGEKHED